MHNSFLKLCKEVSDGPLTSNLRMRKYFEDRQTVFGRPRKTIVEGASIAHCRTGCSNSKCWFCCNYSRIITLGSLLNKRDGWNKHDGWNMSPNLIRFALKHTSNQLILILSAFLQFSSFFWTSKSILKSIRPKVKNRSRLIKTWWWDKVSKNKYIHL